MSPAPVRAGAISLRIPNSGREVWQIPGTQNFDPVARDPVVRVHQMMLTELAGQESYLIEVYRSTLQRLPDAANEQFVRSSRFSGND
jgi:hypothetical protein